MASVESVLRQLRARSRPDQLEGMARYGMATGQRLGVSVPEMRRIAKETGKDHGLALRLWKTRIPDAMIVAAMIADPARLTEVQMEAWVRDIDSWDVCDQVCMNLFDKTPLAWKKVAEWSAREEEFVKRTAFSLLACLAWHDKGAADNTFTRLFPVIERGATDERNFVRKAVNWALRNIGKRNPALNKAAIRLAEHIRCADSRAARWVASHAINELKSVAVRKRLRGRVAAHPNLKNAH